LSTETFEVFAGDDIIVIECATPEAYSARKLFAIEKQDREYGRFFFFATEDSLKKNVFNFNLYRHESFSVPNPLAPESWAINKNNPVIAVETILPNHLFADYLASKIAFAISAGVLEIPDKFNVDENTEHWTMVINKTVDHLTGLDNHDERTH
jgi:hypothetical protein